MKRLIALVLLLMLVFTLAGCGAQEDALTDATPPPVEETPEPIATPDPTPIPTPVPVVAVKDYKYDKLTNQVWALGFRYPAHWISQPGRQTFTYIEPVEENEVGARMAVTVKKLDKKADIAAIKAQFEAYHEVLASQMDNFELSGKVSSSIKFVKRKAYSTTYTAQIDGVAIKGFTIITYITQEKFVYVFHFYAPQDRYDELSPVMQYLEKNVVTLV